MVDFRGNKQELIRLNFLNIRSAIWQGNQHRGRIKRWFEYAT